MTKQQYEEKIIELLGRIVALYWTVDELKKEVSDIRNFIEFLPDATQIEDNKDK